MPSRDPNTFDDMIAPPGGRRFKPSHAESLVRVDAPHFVAGIILRNGRCVAAAPILRWALGKTAAELQRYCKRRTRRFELVAHDPV